MKALKGGRHRRPGVKFTKILRMQILKAQKSNNGLTVFFTLLEFAFIKAVHKVLVKSNPVRNG